MTRREVILILKELNNWRRGADIPQHNPTTIGEAIDFAIKYLEDENT